MLWKTSDARKIIKFKLLNADVIYGLIVFPNFPIYRRIKKEFGTMIVEAANKKRALCIGKCLFKFCKWDS